jgi:hypothetical protein
MMGKFTGNPSKIDGKNTMVSGEDFPNKTNPLTEAMDPTPLASSQQMHHHICALAPPAKGVPIVFQWENQCGLLFSIVFGVINPHETYDLRRNNNIQTTIFQCVGYFPYPTRFLGPASWSESAHLSQGNLLKASFKGCGLHQSSCHVCSRPCPLNFIEISEEWLNIVAEHG